jgi:hypothetical protein
LPPLKECARRALAAAAAAVTVGIVVIVVIVAGATVLACLCMQLSLALCLPFQIGACPHGEQRLWRCGELAAGDGCDAGAPAWMPSGNMAPLRRWTPHRNGT